MNNKYQIERQPPKWTSKYIAAVDPIHRRTFWDKLFRRKRSVGNITLFTQERKADGGTIIKVIK